MLHLFEYIRMLKHVGTQEWVFKEIQQVDRNAFRFKEIAEPYAYVSGLGDQMHYHPPEHCIAGPYLIDIFDPQLIDSLLALLNPYNMRYC